MKTAVAPTVALRDRAEKGYEGRVSAQDDFTDEALPAAAAVADAAAALEVVRNVPPRAPIHWLRNRGSKL